MNRIIINDDNISDEDVVKFGNKSRAILLKENKILTANYGGVFLLPGGSVENGETFDQAILREIKEELGIDYNIEELNELLTIKYYQSNYPTRDNEIINRLITTKYYITNYKGIDINESHRTKEEIEDNFYLKLLEISELEQLLNNNGENPRKGYFDRELKEVIKVLKLNKYK